MGSTPSLSPLPGGVEVVTVGDRDLQLSASSSQAFALGFNLSHGGTLDWLFLQTTLLMPAPVPFKLKTQEFHSLVPFCTWCGLLFLPCQAVKEEEQRDTKGIMGTQR